MKVQVNVLNKHIRFHTVNHNKYLLAIFGEAVTHLLYPTHLKLLGHQISSMLCVPMNHQQVKVALFCQGIGGYTAYAINAMKETTQHKFFYKKS